ncbi:MAG: Ni/Fe hydrogenase [Clostridiales bacterium GWF2_36_10]|nr:MAG: Ni/Fe hydrogenase [Clostridiales bacterium GWF2_36_10]HAN20082.1 Ni/Fe hydrogenase [Clostridiales bacterium]
MPERITINPVTRISGFMEIQADIENNIIIDAKTKGIMFRGFEKMLMGRNPFDAVYFTERICGICSTAHAMASTIALENVMGIVPSEQGRYLRDIVHGCEFLQNHLRHFFQFTIPDFVKMPEEYPLFKSDERDFRLPKEKNDRMVKDYFDSLEYSRNAHQMLAILGGKAPHNHGIFIGGITTQATADMIISILSILTGIGNFIEERMIPDIYEIGDYYPEYYKIGGGYGNLLSYGCFDNYLSLGTLYVDPLVYTNNTTTLFNPNNITQEVDYSYFKDNVNNEYQETDILKEKAYSFIKAPRYNNIPYEVGPLARQWLSGEYRNGISTMDRLIARVLEAKKIVSVMKILLQNLIPGTDVQKVYEIPKAGAGKGLIDTTRGALGHWITIKDSKILLYQIITPSAWNLSSQSVDNMKGTAEQTLIGTPVKDTTAPAEIVRTIRSFDPCVSCATHVYTRGNLVYSKQFI